MSDKSLSLFIFLLGIMIGLSLSISNVNAIVVNNTDFSLNVLDNWAYQDSTTSLAEAPDKAWINLFPNEFSHIFVNTSLENWANETNQKEGASSSFTLDIGYPYRNVPVDSYSEYYTDMFPVKIFSRENTTIAGEPAVKVHRSDIGNSANVEVVDYYTVHKGKPYFIQYTANVKNFQKYLPQFEQMLK